MIQLPSNEDLDVMADWAELSCLFHPERSFVSRAEIERSLEDGGLDAESRVEDIWREIDRRHQLASTSHPVVVEQHRLTRAFKWAAAPAYSFQLLISNHLIYAGTKVSPSTWNSLAKLFEGVVAVAVSRYCGQPVVIMGAPREQPVPSRFTDALDYLVQSIGEARGSGLSMNDDIKDDDVDLVSWASFGDMRPGQLMLFVQCAAGRTDWQEKTTTLALDLWQDHIDWAVAPIRGFAFPFVPFQDSDWRRLSKEGGVLFDRLRISTLYASGGSKSELEDRLITWCEKQASQLPWETR